ncbi:MAG TPA: ABC transporter ATP-binding protein [Gammaproteobacteria bacterium]|nr:ABC transporter ATP-binding protein [Gammaproteobacteria bacterium]
MSEIILTANHICKRFGDEHDFVLNNVDFTLSSGESVAITGVSGSGKTTLMHILAGLDRPTSGTTILCDHVLEKMDNHQLSEVRGHLTGFVFQFHHLLFEFNVFENVALSARLAGMPNDIIKDCVEDAFNNLGLAPSLWYAPVQQLSGGERQRVACARAVVHQPKVLFADEPTGCLDSMSSKKVMEYLLSYQKSSGCGIVLVTHDCDIAAMMSHHYRLQSGEVVA